jgi:F-type H+-transporting ATPase subunit a
LAVLTLASWFATRRLSQKPGRRQAVLEVIVTNISGQIEDVIRKDPRPFLALLGTLFIFLVVANLSGVLPVVEPPTGELETPAALALLVFASVHYFGVRAQGPLGYLVIAVVVALAGLFVPIPLMALEILVGVVQGYIFTVLATVFIGAAVGSVERG